MIVKERGYLSQLLCPPVYTLQHFLFWQLYEQRKKTQRDFKIAFILILVSRLFLKFPLPDLVEDVGRDGECVTSRCDVGKVVSRRTLGSQSAIKF